MAVKLSKRLTALAQMVTPGNRLADVGTDHGYIPIYLCQTDVIPSAIAMDINQGPLDRAQEHIAETGLGNRIETRLSDGLQHLRQGEADTILIAGMGGGLVMKILTEGEHALLGVREFILQPQSELMLTRQFLRQHGYVILDEDMIEEDGKYYPMMKVQRNSEGVPVSGNDLEDAFGPILLARKHPVLQEWLQRELSLTESILDKLEIQMNRKDQGGIEKLIQRSEELKEKQSLLLNALERMKKG